MRSSAAAALWLLVTAVLPSLLPAQDAGSGESLDAARLLLRQGQFPAAASAFRNMIERQPSLEAYAGLIQSLLKNDEVAAAEASSQEALRAFPNSALTRAERGDVYFRRGLLAQAENEYAAALKISETCARAWLGSGKIDEVMSRRAPARAAVTKARELDPDDGDALYEWAIRQPYPGNVAALEKHLTEFRSDPEMEVRERDYAELLKALNGRPVWILASDVSRAELKLESVAEGPGLPVRGYGLRVTFNGRATDTLLLDTGSSGITISRKFAEKIGARKLSDQTLLGLGKEGGVRGYQAWVDKVAIGGLEFHDCLVHVVPKEVPGRDGLIGTDVFAKFLVTLDFPSRKLRLDPLVEAAASADDRPAETHAFSPIFSFGHLLLIRTQAGDKAEGLFLIDSGSNVSSIAAELSKQLSQFRPLQTAVTGMSGRSSSAFVADAIVMQFSNVRRRDQRMVAVDLHSVSKNLGTEISGQIGFNTLEKMLLVIDYRDGLVKFTDKR